MLYEKQASPVAALAASTPGYDGVPQADTQYGLLSGRVTYVIDKQGIVRLVFSAISSPVQHITEALNIVKASNNQ